MIADDQTQTQIEIQIVNTVIFVYFYSSVRQHILISNTGPGLLQRQHTLLVPKVGVRDDLYMVEAMVNQIEQAKGYTTRVGLEALIETALGMANVESIAQFGGRLEALHFGVADYAASMRARTTNIGGLNPHYPGDQWHAAISRMVIACRAYGLRAIDGPFGDFSDPEGYKDGARRAAALGCEGKWAIHPSQIGMANEVMSPSEAEVTRAQRILAAMEQAAAEGKGAVSLDGRLIECRFTGLPGGSTLARFKCAAYPEGPSPAFATGRALKQA